MSLTDKRHLPTEVSDSNLPSHPFAHLCHGKRGRNLSCERLWHALLIITFVGVSTLFLTQNQGFSAARTYVVNNTTNSVTVWDLQINSVVGTIAVGNNPTEITFASNNLFAYVPNETSNSVSVIDLSLQSVVATIPVGMAPAGLVLSPNDRYGYVINGGSNDLTIFDTSNNTVLTTLPVGTTPVSINISSNGLYLFIANQDSNDVTVVNTADSSIVTTIAVGSKPNQVGLTPDNKQAFVINTGSNNVTVIDTATFAVLRTIAVGNSPVGLAFSVDGQWGYITNRSSNTVSQINVAQGTVSTTFNVGTAPIGIALTGDGRFAYVSNSGSNNLSVFDTSNPTSADTISVGLFPFSIVLDPNENFVYVANLNSNNVSVISTNTDTVVKTVSVGSTPLQFAFLNAPTLLGVSQGLGTNSGGTALQIIGSGFVEGATVDFGGSGGTVISFSPYSLKVSTGSHSPGTVSVNVTNPDQSSDSLPQGFTYSTGSSAFQILFPSSLDTNSFRTNLGINNISEGATNAMVSLYDTGGNIVASQSYNVPSRGLNQVNFINQSLLASGSITNTTGSLRVSASQPISGFASIIDNVSQDPSLEVAAKKGDSHLLVPSVTNFLAFRSNLVVKNLSGFAANVNLTARDTSGSIVASRNNLTIAANGSLENPDILTFLGATGKFGPLEILSTNGALLVATSRVFSNNPGGGTNGGFLEAQSYNQTFKALFIPFVIDAPEFRTNLGLNNPGSTNARVTVLFFNKVGDLRASGTTTVLAGGLTQVNSIVRKMLSNPSKLDLSLVPDPGFTSNQEGYLQIVSTQPLFAWASQIDNSNNDPSLEIGQRLGFIKLLLSSSTNKGLFRSTLSLLNTQSTEANIEIVFRDTGGAVQGSRTAVIPANGLFSEDDILTSLNLVEQFGPLEISVSNGVPVIAISQVYSTNRTSAFFEAKPVD
jgi:YVTN family beta-propeller protein